MGVLGEKWLSRVSPEVIPGGQTVKLKVLDSDRRWERLLESEGH